MEDVVTFGREIVEEESRTLLEVAGRLDGSFANIANALIERKLHARVLLCGTGKAGYVAMKISATFASVGVPSFYIHPSEATHGDLGRVQEDDIVLMLSNSGETEEVVRLISPLKSVGVKLFAITSNRDSSLARAADATICLGPIREAGAPHLAPTSSAVAMIAIGDALGMCVANRRNLTAQQFRQYHPGGTLGRALLPIDKVMRTGEFVCCVEEHVPTKEVIRRYTATPGRPGAAVIVASDGTVSGIFTDGNLRRLLTEDEHSKFLKSPISEVMTRNPRSISSKLMAKDALELLTQYKIDQVVVVDDNNKAIGLVDIQDVAQIFRGVE